MKPAFALVLLGGALSAYAQSYTTIDVYEDCTDTMEGTDTITSIVVETTCPLCTGMSQTQFGQYTHTTVYTTVWETLCSTGMTPATYTITESCTGPTPTFSSGPNHIPQGYTTTVTICTICAEQPWIVTMTVPCESTPPPASTRNDGQQVGVGTTITTAACPGSTICHYETTETAPAISLSVTTPYAGGAAPVATVFANFLGGALAVAGMILI